MQPVYIVIISAFSKNTMRNIVVCVPNILTAGSGVSPILMSILNQNYSIANRSFRILLYTPLKQPLSFHWMKPYYRWPNEALFVIFPLRLPEKNFFTAPNNNYKLSYQGLDEMVNNVNPLQF